MESVSFKTKLSRLRYLLSKLLLMSLKLAKETSETRKLILVCSIWIKEVTIEIILFSGTIIFGSDQEVAGVMRAVKRSNATGSFSWIGSDGWSARSLVSDGNEAEVEGTLSVQPQANPVQGFEEYFLSLNVENNRRNPWFVGKSQRFNFFISEAKIY